MSKTLFWYVFRDLLRIFMLASGTLAGIMSFGGLLRPLTEHGLNAAQVGRMLTYFMPAMTTYSFPIAALFATTIVYGRLSADNELSACRASGISYLSMATPAIVLGLSVALASLLFLCFIVPTFTLKVEKVIYSNLAQVVQNEIERSHEIKLGEKNVFAQAARVLEPDPARPRVQRVELIGPMITRMEPEADKEALASDPKAKPLYVPVQFDMAKRATAFIEPKGERVDLTIVLENVSTFSSDLKSGIQGTLGAVQVDRIPFPSPIKEDTKFMTIDRLKFLYENPELSVRVRDQLFELIRNEQQGTYLSEVRRSLAGTGVARMEGFVFGAGGERPRKAIVLTRGDGPVGIERGRTGRSELVLRSRAMPNARQVKAQLIDLASDKVEATYEAVEMRIRADPRWTMPTVETLGEASEPPQLDVQVSTFDSITTVEDQAVARPKFTLRPLSMDMPEALAAMQQNTVGHYLTSPYADPAARKQLDEAQRRLGARLLSEIHSRASFAISCLVLVLVGCTLGMMFRSGDFLSAFVLSFLPAILCIVLIVTGQQICSRNLNALTMGLTFIWSGNAAVLVLAVGLLWRLQRQ